VVVVVDGEGDVGGGSAAAGGAAVLVMPMLAHR
jgi:hypothetical protein